MDAEENPSIPLGRRINREAGAEWGPPHPHSGLGPGILNGVGLLVGRSRAPAGGMPYPPDLARRLRPGVCQAAGPFPAPISPASPGLDWVWGSARGSVDPQAGTVQEAEDAWFPGLGGCLRPGATWATGILPYDATALPGMA